MSALSSPGGGGVGVGGGGSGGSGSSGGGDTTPPVGQRFKYFVVRLLDRLRAVARRSTGGGDGCCGVDGLVGASQMILMGQPRTVSFSAFRVLFRSIMWFSYRSNFPMIPNSLYNSDTGWGCMLRSLQMVMAHAFQRHYSSSEWNVRTGAGGVGGGELQDPEYCQATRHQIIEFFADDPSAPYSIHKLVELGGFFGKKPGEWYGPVLASHIARMANEAHMADEAELESPRSVHRSQIGRGDSGNSASASESDDGGRSVAGGAAAFAHAGSVSGFLNKPMAVFTAQDGVVATKEIEAYFAKASSSAATGGAVSTASQMTQPLRRDGNRESVQSSSGLQPASVAAAASEKSLLLLIPLRLGIHTIAQHHLAMLRGTLQLPQSVGFIGGSPAHSLYFVGTDEHGRFAYLDPHTTQRALQPARRIRFWQNPHNVEAFAQESTRPREGSLRVLAGEALDPTLALAFFFDGPESFAEFLELAEPFSGPAAVAQGTAMFSFAEFVCHGMDASDRQQHHSSTQDLVASCMYPSTSFAQTNDEGVGAHTRHTNTGGTDANGSGGCDEEEGFVML